MWRLADEVDVVAGRPAADEVGQRAEREQVGAHQQVAGVGARQALAVGHLGPHVRESGARGQVVDLLLSKLMSLQTSGRRRHGRWFARRAGQL